MTEQNSTLASIQAQIEALEKQKQEIVSKEKENKILEMKKDISMYGITASELGFSVSMAQKIARATSKTTTEKVVKYKNGDLTWSGGRGPKPKWIVELQAAGQDIEQYKVAE